jgi:Response regulators consisting of a CheY-like receiver domain and a winged-helix DNA-binding domain
MLNRLRILWVDDECDTAKFASRTDILAIDGIVADLVRGPDEAWSYLREHPLPDCVVVDIMMPPGERYSLIDTAYGALTGIRFIEELRSAEVRLPVIVVTVRAVHELEGIEHLEPIAYLTKPVLTSEIAAAIRAIVNTD